MSAYKRLLTRQVQIGDLLLGADNPIRIQTMTTTDTLDIKATAAQTIRCIEAGAELVRITAPSKREAEALADIKQIVRAAGFNTPLVADIHFTPNAAEIAARLVEKVRINPGNYIDKKKFDFIEYSDAAYQEEIDRIRERFTPLLRICKEWGTAMRIGTNHGSLSDRIMSRYGDTPLGMVESAMEFLRVARDEEYHNIVLSMKSSNPQVMVQAYRLLVKQMQEEFGECYPLHLGVTEAGDGEDGRIKSAIGIGTLLEEGIGDTIRVSLTEDPEFELPVCKDLVGKYNHPPKKKKEPNKPLSTPPLQKAYDPFAYSRRPTQSVINTGGANVPVVIADYMLAESIQAEDLRSIGYTYDALTDKWTIADGAADYIFLGSKTLDFQLPGTLRPVVFYSFWKGLENRAQYIPCMDATEVEHEMPELPLLFVSVDVSSTFYDRADLQKKLADTGRISGVVLCLLSSGDFPLDDIRNAMQLLKAEHIQAPVIICAESSAGTVDSQLIEFATLCGGLLLDGLGDGLWLMNDPSKMKNRRATGRTYLEVKNNQQFLNNTAFSILQATRTRISKTEYISCPSCGRTLFDLQETTARIRNATHHLKGIKIAIMGCIVNGPGEMADADFGYVGSGPGKITLYKNKDVMKKNVPSEIAVDELIQLLKDNDAWVEPAHA